MLCLLDIGHNNGKPTMPSGTLLSPIQQSFKFGGGGVSVEQVQARFQPWNYLFKP